MRRFPLKVRKGVDRSTITEVEREVGDLPEDLRSFYQVANGLRYEWFNFLPIELQTDIKDTWDGLKRANSKQTRKCWRGSDEDLRRFLVIAEIGGGHCACLDRSNGSIWFQDEEGLHQTDLTLAEFVETSLREVAEL